MIVAALVAGLVAQAAAMPPGFSGDVTVSGDRVTYEGGTGRILLEGHAVVQRGPATLRARSASYDPETGEVRASGGVLLVDPTRVVFADAVRAVLGGELEAQEVVAFVKDRPVDLGALRTAEEMRRAGRNAVSFSGSRMEGTAQRLYLTDARLTLCDCGTAPPSWEIAARRADVIPGERAILRGAVIRVTPLLMDRQVPILYLPWLYVPLGERQSGLLFPVVGATHAGGFTYAQPVFLTLGRSADATLTPAYSAGHRHISDSPHNEAVSGPSARLELRWAPAVGAEGRVEGAWMYDGAHEPRGEAGNRWGLVGDHVQRLGATDVQATLRLAGDGVWVRDTSPDSLVRALPYQRSDVLVSHRTDALVAEGGAAYDQPLLPYGYETGVRWGPLGTGVHAGSRLGGATLTLLPEALGPLRVSGRVGATRFGPAEGAFDLAGRPAASRADGRLELTLPLLLGGALSVAPYVRGAGLAYAFDARAVDPLTGSRPDALGAAWGVAGAVVESEVSRRYGDYRHAITPRIEWRGGSDVSGGRLPVRSYDQLDRSSIGQLSAAPGPFEQLRVSLGTRLEGPKRTAVYAEVGQDADLRAGRFAEAFAALGGAAGPFVADTRARFFPIDRRLGPLPPSPIRSWLDELSELAASVALQDHRGNALRAGFFSVGPGGSGALLTGLDPLFDVRPSSFAASASATAGVRAALGPALIGYDVLMRGRAAIVESCVDSTATRRVSAGEVEKHTASLTWESPCHCFRIQAHAIMTDCLGSNPSWGISIDVSRAASAGSAALR